MFSAVWKMLKDTVLAFINDEALSRGAAIAFYTVTSIAPVLLIVIAIAGLAFGQDAAQNALTAQLSGLVGQQTAEDVGGTALVPERLASSEPCLPAEMNQWLRHPRCQKLCKIPATAYSAIASVLPEPREVVTTTRLPHRSPASRLLAPAGH